VVPALDTHQVDVAALSIGAAAIVSPVPCSRSSRSSAAGSAPGAMQFRLQADYRRG
jgi:hypothetical protein